MQLKVTFKGNRIRLPIATSHTIQGVIYNALRNDASYSYNLHENGSNFDTRKYKLFSFSELYGRYEIAGKEIIYPTEAYLEIRAADAYMIQLLFKHFTTHSCIRLGNNTVEVADLHLLDEKIHTDNIKVKTLSPITVYLTENDGHTTYFSPHDEMFYTSIITNAERKWNSHSQASRPFNFEISPCENTRFIKRATHFKQTFITAWHGDFYLKGDPQILDFLYHTGLGSKNSQGFGMFKLL